MQYLIACDRFCSELHARSDAIWTCWRAGAAQERREGPGAIQQLALGLAAAALVHTAPANAGVVFQKSQTKKVCTWRNTRPVHKGTRVLRSHCASLR